ncbi:porin family protein [Chryseobacterium lathyri]|uniref:Opacity protein-like surface antigen n=1 Tax=Chryseobacterium lathyri TaxID=395933 RepID=A0ABT9SPD8_9FLAO|nr:porin family protein [Chryseobacterium lathyri]MDP9961267.1 opacity protein-like surface antigen [Chryseobacterium lathyri]
MKKILLVGAIQFAFFLNAQSTNDFQKRSISYGVKGGLNVSDATDQSFTDGVVDINQKSRIGFNAGAFVNIPISKSFSIQPELLFSQYGYKTTFFSNNMGNDYDPLLGSLESSGIDCINYIVLPIMAQYNIIPKFYVETGLELGFNIMSKVRYYNNTDFSGNKTEFNNKDFRNTFNFGVGAGAGYYFTNNIGITARYILGLTDIEKNASNLPNKSTIKNKVFQVGLAYKF